MYLESRKHEKKDLIKIEAKELTDEERAKISLLGPNTTISIIRDYRVVEKAKVKIPEVIAGVLRCPNPSCITNHESRTTKFHVERSEPLEVRCHHCERVVSKEAMELR
jgi:aspartate carbamoyltransferase regulatory subunit